MTFALAGRVEDAMADLDERERFVLQARERKNEDYKQIAAQLETGREAVADLLVSARLAVRAHVRDAPAPPRRSPQCGPARRVMAAQHDGEPLHPEDLDRLREHLSDCAPCREARLALREASLACAAWRRTPRENLGARRPEGGMATTARRAGRRRLAVAAAAALLVLVLLVAALSGGDDTPGAPAPPRPQAGSAAGSGQDVIPPPGDQFCAEGETGCP
jgi:hypothetical protein